MIIAAPIPGDLYVKYKCHKWGLIDWDKSERIFLIGSGVEAQISEITYLNFYYIFR